MGNSSENVEVLIACCASIVVLLAEDSPAAFNSGFSIAGLRDSGFIWLVIVANFTKEVKGKEEKPNFVLRKPSFLN
jgi:hypothetical protein